MKVHVIGAGLAGLAAATALAQRGHVVEVLEAAAYAGGRCRSYYDGVLEMTLDNGNHLLLSGNEAAFAYLRRIGAERHMRGPDQARLDFFDRGTHARWTIKPNDGPLPWWLLSKSRRVPETRALDYLTLAKLALARGQSSIGEASSCRGPLWDRLLDPFLLAALNTPAKKGSAALAGSVIRQSLARGGKAYRPRIASPTLAAALIDPAIDFLEQHGGKVSLKTPVKSLVYTEGCVVRILTAEEALEVEVDAAVILAAPPWIAAELIPGLVTPNAFNAIVNGHFRYAPPRGLAPIVGVIGGLAQWVFAFEDRLSVTVSAAGDLADDDREAVAQALWADVAAVHALPATLPPWRIVKERRATFAATPEQEARRPRATTPWRNLFLAGDWTATGLPATIEGAVRSGDKAARLALAS